MSDEERLEPVTFDPTKQYDLDFKLVLLGYTSVGKTAIIRNFIENRAFDESCGTVATIGGCFSSVIVNYKGKDVLLKCWDTGGQERHLALTASYYRGASIAFVVFSWTDRHSWDGQLASVKYWIDELRKNNPSCRIILLGNKYDCIDPRYPVISEEEVAEFCKQMGLGPCIKTSAFTSVGIHTAFRRAIEEYFKANGMIPDDDDDNGDNNGGRGRNGGRRTGGGDDESSSSMDGVIEIGPTPGGNSNPSGNGGGGKGCC